MDGPAHTFLLRPSGVLLAARVLAHLVALSACGVSGDPSTGTLLALLVVCSLVRELRLHRLARPVRLGQAAEGWWLEACGLRVPVEILGQTSVRPLGVALRLRTARGRRWLLLAPDSASPGDLRRLRVALRLGARGSGREEGVLGLR